MPPKRFEGKFGIPSSHPVESLLTQALYRLPDSVSSEQVEGITDDVRDKVNEVLRGTGKDPLSDSEVLTLKLKLARHYEDNGAAAPIDIPTVVDALVESPRFLQSDKGSFAKLFDLHEMKTLQKIAELRRKKSEQAGNEEFNPYENLFETSNSSYYLARLLNMPHLEEESSYMDHCVGTSNSYINKIKRGEVEIFSFRDKSTNQPVVTIEYDTRSHRLLQVKGLSDRIPTLADEFAPNLLEAIERLPETLNDQGASRSVKSPEALHLRHLLDLQQKQVRSELFTKDDLVFLYEVDEPIKGFDDDREPLIAELRKNRNVEEDMLVIFECTRDEIAHVPSQITENTKAYVGKLETGIFQKLPDDIKHVYTSFPDRKIKIEELGEAESKTGEEWIESLEQAGIKISDYAKSMLKNPDFAESKNTENSTLVRLTIGDIGFPQGATTDQIYGRAELLGLELCPAEVGPQYRLKYQNQPMNEWSRIAMKQISGPDGNPNVFRLARDGDDLWLYYNWAKPGDVWSPYNEFVFRLRKYKS